MNEGLPMKQILLVEDDHDIAALLRLNLEDEGYAITHEPDGGKALQRLEKQPWDAVILDLMLPTLTVWRFAAASVR
jgi:DNA-binding response OmpR family regulator